MCISTVNTHTTPLGLLHFPSLLCRVSGCINSSWAHKFREPPWKENSETKGRERHFQCRFVLLQEAQRQPFRQQKPQVTEWALPTRREAAAPCTWSCGGMQAPFPPLDFYCCSRRRCGSKARLQGARHPAATGAVQTTLCSEPCAAILQHESVAELWRATQ